MKSINFNADIFAVLKRLETRRNSDMQCANIMTRLAAHRYGEQYFKYELVPTAIGRDIE